MNPNRASRRTRPQEQGGMLILLALVLLSILTIAAFSLSRTSLRELATTGNIYQAGRADTAADAGIDWFVAWTGLATSEGGLPPHSKPADVAQSVLDMLDAPTHGGLQKAWKANVSEGTDPFLLQGRSPEGAVTQAFDLQLDFLGNKGGDPAGGKNVRGFTTSQYAWELTSTGQALVKSGSDVDDYLRYRTMRAAKLDIR